jgi:hypothetical protein
MLPHHKDIWRSRESWFLVSLCLFWKCYSLVNPGNLQLDLVFPRENGTYSPLEAFPIVLLLHNINIAWPYRPRMTWTLSSVEKYGENNELLDQGTFPHEEHYSAWTKRGFWDESPSNFLFINTTTLLDSKRSSNQKRAPFFGSSKQEVSKAYQLEVQLILGDQGCQPSSPPSSPPTGQIVLSSPSQAEPSMAISSTVIFNISTKAGRVSQKPQEQFDLRHLGEFSGCPRPLGTIGILGTQENENDKDRACPLLRDPPPAAKHCAMKIDDHIRTEVARAIAKASTSRQTQKWKPNKGNAEGKTFQSGAAVMAAVTGTMFGILGLILSLWTIWAGDSILLEIA